MTEERNRLEPETLEAMAMMQANRALVSLSLMKEAIRQRQKRKKDKLSNSVEAAIREENRLIDQEQPMLPIDGVSSIDDVIDEEFLSNEMIDDEEDFEFF